MKLNVRKMVLCSLFAALIAVCAWIALPIPPVAVTLQTFGVLMALGVLGGKWGCFSIFLYLAMGLAGLPVFAGFRGGPAVLLEATGGFLWGFALAGPVYRLLERFGRLPAMVIAQLVCYLCGCLWFYLYAGGGLLLILLRCVFPFLLPDAAKIALAYILSRRLARHLT